MMLRRAIVVLAALDPEDVLRSAQRPGCCEYGPY